MNREPSVLVVGETIVDMHPVGESDPTTVGTTEADSASADTPEADPVRTDTRRAETRATRYERRLGGAPTNVAVGVARLGGRPALWSRVGDDPLGAFCRDRLAAEGVAMDRVRTDPDAPTGLSVVSRDADGDRSFTLYLAGVASTRLDPDRIDADLLAGVEWLHVGGVELAHEPARSAVLRLVERAESATVSFDPNYRAALWDEFDYADSLSRVLPAVDVVVASPEDLAPAGYDGDPATVAADLTTEGPHTAFVTRGADGAVARASERAPWGRGEVARDALDIAVADTTGAGDAFTAGVIRELGPGGSVGGDAEPLARATRVGNAVAAASVTARGAVTGLPDAATVRERLVEE